MGRVNLIVAALLMLSAISLVTSRYQSRQLFVELGRDQAHARDLETNWRRLQLERAVRAQPADREQGGVRPQVDRPRRLAHGAKLP